MRERRIIKKLPLLALLLTSCFATSQPFYLPDGSRGYRLDCSQYMGGVPDCLQKAGDICGANGYQMYDQNGHLVSEDSELQTVIATINKSADKKNPQARSLHTSSSSPNAPGKSMFIKCRSDETIPRLAPAGVPPVETKPSTLPKTLPADSRPIPLHSQ